MRPLRPYQADAIERGSLALRAGKRAPLFVAPTGAGKTRIGVEIVERALRAAHGRRVLWLAHRRELVEQAVESLVAEGIGADRISVLRAGSRSHDPARPICVASTQTMLVVEDRPPANVVVFDEAHHYVAEQWFEVADAYENAVRVGLTATPGRSDGIGLGALFDELVEVASIEQLTTDGVLVPCDVVWPGARLKSRKIAADPVDAYLAHVPGSSCIVFCADVEAAKDVAARFMQRGIPAACVEGSMSGGARKAAIDAFRAKRLRVLVNVFVLTEGFDAPHTDAIILARGCSAVSTYLQIVGRALRCSPGKTRATLVDLVGAFKVHGMPDARRVYSLEGDGIRLASGEKPEAVRQCATCGCVFAAGPRECPRCGAVPEYKPIEVDERELVRAKRSDVASPEERETFLDWLEGERFRKGYEVGWVSNRYRARFGGWPHRKVRRESVSQQLVREANESRARV
jgi:DNA repair protein RadD